MRQLFPEEEDPTKLLFAPKLGKHPPSPQLEFAL